MGWLEVGLVFGLFAGLGSLAIIAKSHAQSVKVKSYIDAARVAGGSSWHIMRFHYLPHMISLMLVNMMFTVTQSVLIEALLSFFGRTQIRMSWGTMIWFTQVTFRLSAFGEQWHAVLAPAMAITLFCGSFYILGRALDEVINPKLRQISP
jgi:peptide/nickel transport system permease protein